MSLSRYAVIAGSGSYIPTRKISNDYFLNHTFYGTDGIRLDKANEEIIRKFKDITGISERRYITGFMLMAMMHRVTFRGMQARQVFTKLFPTTQNLQPLMVI